MSVRPKNKVYHYTPEGKYLKTFESESELRREYYSTDNGNRPIFNRVARNKGKIYHYNNVTAVLPDGSIVSRERIGRTGVLDYIRKRESPYTNISKEEPLIEVINLDNSIIAMFKGAYIASKMTGIHQSTIHHQVTRGNKTSHSGLIFRYK